MIAERPGSGWGLASDREQSLVLVCLVQANAIGCRLKDLKWYCTPNNHDAAPHAVLHCGLLWDNSRAEVVHREGSTITWIRVTCGASQCSWRDIARICNHAVAACSVMGGGDEPEQGGLEIGCGRSLGIHHPRQHETPT